jgi:hypothetical protein
MVNAAGNMLWDGFLILNGQRGGQHAVGWL